MRIISQNGNYSINFDSTHIWKQYECIYAHVDSGKDIVLGHYETDKRAEEVFIEIHNGFLPIKALESASQAGLQAVATMLQVNCYFMPEK